MGHQHRELCHRLEDAERLQLYAKVAASEHRALKQSLGKAQSWSRHWERKAKEGFEKTTTAEKYREEAKEEAQVAQLATVVASDARAKLEGDLVRVKDALAATEEVREVVEEARSKADFEASRLEVNRTSLLLELGMVKDEVSSL